MPSATGENVERMEENDCTRVKFNFLQDFRNNNDQNRGNFETLIISMILENNNDQIMTIMTSHYYNDQVATLIRRYLLTFMCFFFEKNRKKAHKCQQISPPTE